VSNLFRARATKREHFSEGHILNYILCEGHSIRVFQITLFQILMNHYTIKFK